MDAGGHSRPSLQYPFPTASKGRANELHLEVNDQSMVTYYQKRALFATVTVCTEGRFGVGNGVVTAAPLVEIAMTVCCLDCLWFSFRIFVSWFCGFIFFCFGFVVALVSPK